MPSDRLVSAAAAGGAAAAGASGASAAAVGARDGGGGDGSALRVRGAGAQKLFRLRAAALGAAAGSILGNYGLAAVIAVPRGDLVAPPQLAGDAPVMDILHPVGIGLGKALRHKLDGAVLHHPDGLLGQGLHLHKPLHS